MATFLIGLRRLEITSPLDAFNSMDLIMYSRSQRFGWDRTDTRKTVRDFLFFTLPGVAAYFSSLIPRLEESQNQLMIMIVIPAVGAVVTAIHRWVRDNQPHLKD